MSDQLDILEIYSAHVAPELGGPAATATGTASDNPTDPQTLTDAQASKGVQLFFRSQNGYVDAAFAVTSSTVGCTGRNLLFAGDSALCAPPPPSPKSGTFRVLKW